ncbi:Ig-like domain-containing protein [Litoribacter populi]|uniref:Ig-like domain-containing protein n=1 Tax=Litoribacter populi TaxID=2598460 RepID=UPI00117CE107|nr:PKD domain-containing protein [Litoribacter populi]
MKKIILIKLIILFCVVHNSFSQQIVDVVMEGPTQVNLGSTHTYLVFHYDANYQAIAPSGSGSWSITGNIGNFSYQGQGNVHVTFTQAGSGMIYYYYQDWGGGTFMASRFVTVTSPCTTVTPSASGATRCATGAVTLTSQARSGFTPQWFDSNQTTLLSSNQNFTTPSLSSSKTYYFALRHNSTGCLTNKVPVTATINPLPSANTTPNRARCGSGSVTFTGSGSSNANTYRWYNASSGGSPLATSASYTTASLTTTTNFWVSGYNTSTGCEGPRRQVTATINPIPTANTTANQARCGTGTITFTGAGSTNANTYRWYTASTGGSPFLTAASFTTASLSSTTSYWVSGFNSTTGCEGPRRQVTATINPVPTANSTANRARCGTGTVTFTGTGSSNANTYRWYSASSGGSPLATSASYTTASLTSTTNFWVSGYNTTTGCEGPRRQVTATINPIPSANTTAGAVSCGPTSLSITGTGSSNANTYRWYSVASGGSSIHQGGSYVADFNSTTNLWVSGYNTNTGCEGPRRQVTVTVNPIPGMPTAPSASFCDPATRTSTASGIAGATYRWYSASSGGSLLFEGASYTRPVANTTSVWVAARVNGCEGPRRQVTISVYPRPATPTATSNGRCGPGVVNLTASGSTGVYQWFNSLGEHVASGATYSPNISVTTTYTVRAISNDGCPSPGTTTVTATVNPIPTANTTADQERCGPGAVTFTGTGSSNADTYRWYSASSGGTLLATAASYTTATLTEATSFWVSGYNSSTGCEGPRKQVFASFTPFAIIDGPEVSRCGPGSLLLTAIVEGENYLLQWYNSETDGEIIGEGNEYLTPELQITESYWVEAVNSSTGCVSPRFEIQAVISPAPDSPVTLDGISCGAGEVVLEASGKNAGEMYQWYALATDEVPLATSADQYFNTGWLDTTTVYYVSIVTENGCESQKVPVNAVIEQPNFEEIEVTGSTRYGEGPLVLQIVNPLPDVNYHWLDQDDAILHTGVSFTQSYDPTTMIFVQADSGENCPGSKQAVQVEYLPEFDFDAYNIFCGKAFYSRQTEASACDIQSYEWNYGDGNFGNGIHSLHHYANDGLYTVTLTVNYSCGGSEVYESVVSKDLNMESETTITEEYFKEENIQVTSIRTPKVISSEVSTFRDQWPLAYQNLNLSKKQSYLNGTQGVWRVSDSYYFDRDRTRSEVPSIKEDGSYTLESFNWKYNDLELIPDWVKANTITAYSPFGNANEVRDVLGIYSAELYNNNGQHLIGQGINMKHGEMAFTGFENNDFIEGNWQFGELPFYKWETFEVVGGYGYSAIVRSSMEELEKVDKVNVFARIRIGMFPVFQTLHEVNVVCKTPHPVSPEFTVLVLDKLPIADSWSGYVYFNHPPKSGVVANFDDSFSHSGKRSLKINQNEIFEQSPLNLTEGRNYHVSAWASTKSGHSLGKGLNLKVVIKDKDGEEIGRKEMYPSGQVIEGWQQVKGNFTFPAGAHSIALIFDSGNQPNSWWDDLRLFPEEGEMQSFVYDLATDRLTVVLDEENFATFYFYDAEGNLRLVKKETFDGIKTIQEVEQYKRERGD